MTSKMVKIKTKAGYRPCPNHDFMCISCDKNLTPVKQKRYQPSHREIFLENATCDVLWFSQKRPLYVTRLKYTSSNFSCVQRNVWENEVQ
jgi:hypothetical protein